MNIPCRDNPEPWVSDDRKVRALAATECGACDRLTECRKERTSQAPSIGGVWAGKDYGKLKKHSRRSGA